MVIVIFFIYCCKSVVKERNKILNTVDLLSKDLTPYLFPPEDFVVSAEKFFFTCWPTFYEWFITLSSNLKPFSTLVYTIYLATLFACSSKRLDVY